MTTAHQAAPKVALITGVTGQDGAYLSELLLNKGYEVHGIKRRASLFNTDRIDHLYQDPHVDHQRFKLHYGDLSNSTNLIRIIQQVQPDEIYNLAAMSHVAVSVRNARIHRPSPLPSPASGRGSKGRWQACDRHTSLSTVRGGEGSCFSLSRKRERVGVRGRRAAMLGFVANQ